MLLSQALGFASAPIQAIIPRCWHVASVDSRWEFKAEQSVKEAGFDAYAPRSKHRKVIAKRRREIEAPLFPSYIFVAFDPKSENWHRPILECKGIRGVLSNCNLPVQIQSAVVDRLKRAELAGLFDFTKSAASFKTGDDVEVREGPLAGLIGKVRSASAKKRVKILLGALLTEIDSSALQKV